MAQLLAFTRRSQSILNSSSRFAIQQNNKSNEQQKKSFNVKSGGVQDNGDSAKKGYLVLEDGSVFKGRSFGADRSISGEVVFNTGMVGYIESLTDPSYRGQLLTFTFPLVGNYGVPPKTRDENGMLKFFESEQIHTSGVLVNNYSWRYAHWNAAQSLSEWLRDENIPALTDIDTRALTKKIREKGAMLGKIVFGNDIEFEDPNLRNLVAEVSVREPKIYGKGNIKIVAVDCGMKNNIVRELVAQGVEVHVVPWDYNFVPELRDGKFDGLFISNGPGDPSMVTTTTNNIREAYDIGKPIFGICMGNQLMGLAAGAQTHKLRYGNRGHNQPVIDLSNNKAYITSQNHGFAVDNSSLPPPWKPAFYNANDFSNEGLECQGRPYTSVQFHPEAKGGPYDTEFLFKRFIDQVKEVKEGKADYHFQYRKVKKALILGSGGLQIGQAGEFDYSGSQAIKALKEEGIETILVNPNIATIQTAKGLADRVYFLPVTPKFVEEIIAKERPDGVLLSFGGQTALNCGVSLNEAGVFEKYGVKVLGTPISSIVATEDREIFNAKLNEINERIAPSIAATTIEDSVKAGEKVGFPVIVRAAFSLGGLGSGFANNKEELRTLVEKAFSASPQVLVEKSFKGWKETEYEVVRDSFDNCITVCNMENFDPLGIHTGESIVVAPSQTLTNEEYMRLRLAAIRTVRHLGIIGECNIQYSLDPVSEDYFVIEVNPRLSRSSALASKATGYPLAFVAAKLALGVELPLIANSVTKSTMACFEPSLDYIVTKMPRWDLKKFQQADYVLGSGMKSVGEVMAIGRTFEESIQKAIRMVDSGYTGFAPRAFSNLDNELINATPYRIFAIAEAFRLGYSTQKIYDLSRVDKWFLDKLKNIFDVGNQIKEVGSLEKLSDKLLLTAKQVGYSDKQIASFINSKELDVRKVRISHGIVPIVKQIDTLAAEFPAKTNYLYVTYNASVNDVQPDPDAIMVLGSGVYRIGSSVEFDYGSVTCIRTLRRLGHKTIMINYNPETVSTDYDESERLYFEELSLERVLDIYEYEKPKGIIVSVGGQQPQNLALPLYKYGTRILGTNPLNIDAAEDRYKFSKLLDSINVDQPEWKELTSLQEARKFADKVKYPVLIRPSYVLSGAAMRVAYNHEQLDEFLQNAADVSPEHPVVITKFLENANEIEIDGVANKGNIVNYAVSEHIEYAGVHSGDASLVLPAELPNSVQQRILDISNKISKALEISGPFNIQYLYKDDQIKVIECNLRSSRSFPFASKTYNVDFIETATRIFLGEDVKLNPQCGRKLNHVGVKAPQFSWKRIGGADPVLGVEMASTGEVACYGKNKYEAFLKAVVAAGFIVPKKAALISGDISDIHIESVKYLQHSGLKIYSTTETSPLLKKAGITTTELEINDNEKNGVYHFLKQKVFDLVVNIPFYEPNDAHYRIRRRAIDFTIPVITNSNIFITLSKSLDSVKDSLHITGWDEYFPEEAEATAKAREELNKWRRPTSRWRPDNTSQFNARK